MILFGMLAGNPVQTIVLRALLGLLGGFILGVLAGWVGMQVIKDNLPGMDSDKVEALSEGSETEPS
jgi:hypothetical protein